jgi:CPA2 family monovalent cation:H+ antiporter-2
MGEREIAMGMVDRLAQVHHDRPHYEDEGRAGIMEDEPVTVSAKE